MSNIALAFPINGTKEGAAWQPQRFRYWYDHIIDLLLVEPQLNQKEIAARLGRTPVAIGLIMNSDLFRARYEQRRGAQSEALTAQINGKLSRVAIESLTYIEEKLKLKRHTIPLPDLVDVADKALTRLGYGAKANPNAQSVNVQINQTLPVSAEDLRASRAKLIDAQAQSSPLATAGDASASMLELKAAGSDEAEGAAQRSGERSGEPHGGEKQ